MTNRKGAAMFELHTGDCIDVLKTLPDSSVDSVVTSPPYAMQRASTYGGIPEKDYPEWTVAWMCEVWRVLRDDGSAIVNISPHNRGGNLADYVLLTRLALREFGWVEPDELIWHKPNAFPTGRPDRPRRAWEHLLWFGKGKQAYADPLAAGKPYKQDVDESAFQRSNGVRKRNGWDHAGGSNGVTPLRDRARVTNIVTISKVTRNKFEHPAPFPVELADWCGKLITPPGGTILDPFTGSSSTGVAAIKNGWHFIGIDQSPEYIEMSDRRLGAELAKATERGTGEPTHHPHGKPPPPIPALSAGTSPEWSKMPDRIRTTPTNHAPAPTGEDVARAPGAGQ